ncbi:hypothetical protein [Kitasatospora camelliae]|uniref:Uncharacterized protein n=1 Tax=Kitasatospora camelliae TaxID=3156397 RepID=A0AAU8K4X0_9ACTN
MRGLSGAALLRLRRSTDLTAGAAGVLPALPTAFEGEGGRPSLHAAG